MTKSLECNLYELMSQVGYLIFIVSNYMQSSSQY